MPRTTDALEILTSLFKSDPAALAAVDEAYVKTRAGMLVYQLREDARLTQAQLGSRLAQPAEWVDDLEMGNFGGDSMKALKDVAAALGKNIDSEIANIEKDARPHAVAR